MTNSNRYIYKELDINGSYNITQNERLRSYDIQNSDLSFITPFFNNSSFLVSFKSDYCSISILNKTTVLIDNLLKRYHLEDKKLEFYVLVCSIQKEYIKYFETPFDTKDEMSADFQNLHNEVSELLDVLYTYLLDANSIEKISFKSNTSVGFKNLFIIRDVSNALIKLYGLTLDNFKQKKQEILDDYTTYNLSKLDEKFKFETILELHDFIIKGKPSNAKISNNDLRFVGSILHLSQISINSKSHEIILTDLKNLVSLSDINNLRNYLKRPDRYMY